MARRLRRLHRLAWGAHMRVWLIRKNCSLTPAQTMGALFAASAVVLSIGLLFAVVGHWLVLLFAVVETAILAALVLRYCRHATDCERLSLSHNVLSIEVTECGTTTRRDLIASLIRFDTDDSGGGIVLRYGSEALPVGRHLCAPARRRLMEELRRNCRDRRMSTDDADDDAQTPDLIVVSNRAVPEPREN